MLRASSVNDSKEPLGDTREQCHLNEGADKCEKETCNVLYRVKNETVYRVQHNQLLSDFWSLFLQSIIAKRLMSHRSRQKEPKEPQVLLNPQTHWRRTRLELSNDVNTLNSALFKMVDMYSRLITYFVTYWSFYTACLGYIIS